MQLFYSKGKGTSSRTWTYKQGHIEDIWFVFFPYKKVFEKNHKCCVLNVCRQNNSLFICNIKWILYSTCPLYFYFTFKYDDLAMNFELFLQKINFRRTCHFLRNLNIWFECQTLYSLQYAKKESPRTQT